MLDFRCDQRFGLVSDSLITNTNQITSRSVGRIKHQESKQFHQFSQRKIRYIKN